MRSGPSPVVSVIVPTYQRPDLLERCLAALLAQTLSADKYEIVVCDDGPSSAARAVVENARVVARAGLHIHYLEITETQGPAGARNRGWHCAAAPIIAFTDDDTVPDPAWLEKGVAAMTTGVDAVTGRIEMPLPLRPTDVEVDAAGLTRAEFVTANCFVRREALLAVGGFDERFSIAWREDSDLHFSLLESGRQIRHAPEALVVHPLRETRFGASIGMQKKVMFDVLLYLKHPKLYRERIRPRPPWFYVFVSLSLLLAILALLLGNGALASAAAVAWAASTIWFFVRRLQRSAWTWRNVVELLITSACIPPLSIYWRLVGVSRFGARFP